MKKKSRHPFSLVNFPFYLRFISGRGATIGKKVLSIQPFRPTATPSDAEGREQESHDEPPKERCRT